MEQHKKPGPAHQKLEPFVGRWNTTGQIKATADSPAVSVIGTDTYEWLPGQFFLLHKVDVHIGDEKKESTEVIGFDEASNTYTMHYFDDQGVAGTMRANLTDGIWSFLAPSLRFTGAFSKDGKTLSGVWEQAQNGVGWVPWMEINLTKAN